VQAVVLRVGVVENEWQYRGPSRRNKDEETECPEDGAFDPYRSGRALESSRSAALTKFPFPFAPREIPARRGKRL